MSLRIIFLGTAASIPTVDRALSAVAILRKGELILFDCGEGTQRQMIKAKVGFNRKTRVFITHMHGDHVLGLPGLLQTMSLLGREKSLQIYGPIGIKDFLEAMIRTVRFSLGFLVEIYELNTQGVIYEGKEYEVHTTWAEHSIPSLAYALIEKPRPGRFYPERAVSLRVSKGPLWSRLQQGYQIKLEDGSIVRPGDVLGPPHPGRRIVYVGDTRPSEAIVRLAENADVLIHESTFSDDLADRAKEDMHSTPGEAALVAKKANVKLLILTHVSARYGDSNTILNQAKKTFPNTYAAEDLMKIDVPLLEE